MDKLKTNDMKTIDLNQTHWSEELRTTSGDIKVKGVVTLMAVARLSHYTRDNKDSTLDLSEAENFIDEEHWTTCLGYCHWGPVYGRSGVRDVETFPRLLSAIYGKTVILPEFCVRRHMNRLLENNDVKTVIVHPDSKLFSMKDGDVWNRKGTKLIRENGKE